MPWYEFEASGEDFDVDAFLAQSSLSCTPYHRGDDDPGCNHGLYMQSGFSLTIRAADSETAGENIAQVTHFLTANETELCRLRGFPGVSHLGLRFRYQVPKDAIVGEYLPPELIRLAGSLGIGIELAMY